MKRRYFRKYKNLQKYWELLMILKNTKIQLKIIQLFLQ